MIEKKFFTLGMNGDINLRELPQGAVMNLMNGRSAISKYGRDLRIENLSGTTEVNQSVYPPYGTNICIGSIADDKRDRIIYAIYNTFDDHAIYAFDTITKITYAILYDSQVIGGLNFSKNSRLDRNMRVVGDLLYWTDDLNEPRRMNIEAGIKMNHASYSTSVLPYSYPMNPEVITIIRRPPFYPIDSQKKEDVTYDNNFIANEAFQFAVRYFYRDFEYSVIGAYCELSPYNYSTDDFNYIELTMPLVEIIDQDVLEVELIVRFGNGGKSFVIHTWDKTEIDAHNAGTALTYDFYNDIVGTPIDDAAANKPFDSVPLLSKSLELAKSRLFLANNDEGYSTPTETSLSASVNTVTQGTDKIGIWNTMDINFELNGVTTTITYYFLQVAGTSPSLYYFPQATVPDPPAVPPTPISLAAASFSTSSVRALATFIRDVSGTPYDTWDFGTDTTPYTSVISGGSVVLAGARSFKSNSTYRYAIWFFDKYRRKCGVVIKDGNEVVTPDRTYSQTVYNIGITWTLSNALASDEIPDWAYYYVVGRTKNLSTTGFVQSRSIKMRYVIKDTNGDFNYANTTYDPSRYGVAIDISTLATDGLGYVYNEGDIVNLYFQSGITGKVELPILAQDGQWLICKLQDLQTFTSTVTPLYEIYTPYKQSFNEFYYEVGNIYAINNPTTANRQYSVLSDVMNGDVYLMQRSNPLFGGNFFAEAMSPNDKFWKNWYTDIGWGNIIDKTGRQSKTSSISWSNTLIEGTRTNGLSSFDALDEKAMPIECGEIQKIQAASKITEEGTIMLAICKKQTASLYLSETQLVGASQNAFLAQSTTVIGTINILKGRFGTRNPESVLEYLGLIFWIDIDNGVVVQYSSNGLQAVSRYGQTRFFRRYSIDYASANSNNLDNINGFHHIGTGIDAFHKEVIFTMPALIYENYADIYPSYSSVPTYATSIINRMDIYDQLGKSMAYCYEKNLWGSNYEYGNEWFETINNTMYGWKNGVLWIHEAINGNYNTFYGTYRPMRICFAANFIPSALKVLNNIAIEGNITPNFTVALTSHPNQQITDLSEADYTNQEGNYYAYFLFDRLSPNSSGSTANQKLYASGGDPLTDIAIQIMCEFPSSDKLIYLDYINVGYSYSRGQKQILNIVNQ